MNMSAGLCECVEPDWYHDGLLSHVDGRLCRTCKRREGREVAIRRRDGR